MQFYANLILLIVHPCFLVKGGKFGDLNVKIISGKDKPFKKTRPSKMDVAPWNI